MCVREGERKRENKHIWTIRAGVLTADKIVYNYWAANRGWIETDADIEKKTEGARKGK